MSHREVLKNIVKFGRREYKEKRPLTLKILRVKSKSVLTRGMLPSLNIRQIQGTHFIILADYKEYLRIYSFSRNGQLLGGENIEKKPKLLKELSKNTKLEYHLPKEKPPFTMDDISRHYRDEFEKSLNRMNQLFGFNLKNPYVIIAHKDLTLKMGRMFGCARTKSQEKLVLSPEVYKKDLLHTIIIREIMFLYLRELIVLFQDIKSEIVYWYDLAILFSNFYLRNEKNEFFKKLMEKTTISFLNFQDGSKFYFSDKIIEVLKDNTKKYSTKEANGLLANIFNCLKVLKEYKIHLGYREFANLFYDLSELFIETKDNLYFNQTTESDYYLFHYNHFHKTSEMDKGSKKTTFLSFIFSLLSDKYSENGDFNSLLKEIDILTQDPSIQEEIVNFQALLEDAIIEYIFNKIIQIDFSYEIENDRIDFCVKIINKSQYVFKDFKFNLTWAPKNRLKMLDIEKIKKARDLHEELSTKYYFSINTIGKFSVFYSISCAHPLSPQKRIEKDLKLKTIDL